MISHPMSTGKVGKTGLSENGYIISVLRLRPQFLQFLKDFRFWGRFRIPERL